MRAGAPVGKRYRGKKRMKTQMKFQKILCLLTLIIGALAFVYACSFMTGDLAALYKYTTLDWNILNWKYGYESIGADIVYPYASSVNGVLVTLGVILIIAAIVPYIASNNKRRNYYITNYVASIVCAAVYCILAIVCIALISSVLSSFLNDINWDVYEEMGAVLDSAGESYYGECVHTYVMFILGYIMYAIVLLNAVAIVLNLIWKRKLMQGEQALLAGGLTEEVAQ